MEARNNEQIVRSLLDAIINQRRLDLAEDAVTADFIFHSIPGLPRGPQGFLQTMTMYHTAFPDIQATFDDVLADGDRVVVRQTFRGTHQGPLGPIAPTGKQAQFSGIFIFRLEGGRLAEEWAILDRLGLQQQLGVLPGPPMGAPSGPNAAPFAAHGAR